MHPKLRGGCRDVFYDAGGGAWFVRDSALGEMSRYDFAVEHKAPFVRVQVKSTMFLDRGGYVVTVRGWKGKYTGDPFDFAAAYLIPLDLWYILPVDSFKMQGNVGLYREVEEVEVWAI